MVRCVHFASQDEDVWPFIREAGGVIGIAVGVIHKPSSRAGSKRLKSSSSTKETKKKGSSGTLPR